MQSSELVIALDGPSGSGKSSVARTVAATLGLRYLDTGAMYRAVTLWMLRHEVDVGDADAVAAVVDKPQLAVGTDPVSPAVCIDDRDVSDEIRTREVTVAVSAVSAVSEVRRRMVAMQAEIIAGGGIVVEGRDIGTVVAPWAPVKVFLTASSQERAQRRTRELTAERSGGGGTPEPDVARTRADMGRRDRLDAGRAASPMVMAEDAVQIDSTPLGFDEVVGAVLEAVRQRTGDERS